MDINVKHVDVSEREYVEIGCHEQDRRVNEIIRFVKGLDGSVAGVREGKQYEIPVVDIMYFESVDNRTFIYTAKMSYETSRKLYEFESELQDSNFLRISKSVVLNIMKVESIRPALNGRFLCKLRNGEEVIISRKYVGAFREYISRKV